MSKKYKAGFLIKKLNTIHEHNLNNMLREYELTMSQTRVLIYLSQNVNKETKQKDIEMNFGISNPTVSGILNRLEGKGLIQRHSNNADARIRLIYLSESGKALEKEIKARFEKEDEYLIKELTTSEREQFITLLYKVLEANS